MPTAQAGRALGVLGRLAPRPGQAAWHAPPAAITMTFTEGRQTGRLSTATLVSGGSGPSRALAARAGAQELARAAPRVRRWRAAPTGFEWAHRLRRRWGHALDGKLLLRPSGARRSAERTCSRQAPLARDGVVRRRRPGALLPSRLLLLAGQLVLRRLLCRTGPGRHGWWPAPARRPRGPATTNASATWSSTPGSSRALLGAVPSRLADAADAAQGLSIAGGGATICSPMSPGRRSRRPSSFLPSWPRRPAFPRAAPPALPPWPAALALGAVAVSGHAQRPRRPRLA